MTLNNILKILACILIGVMIPISINLWHNTRLLMQQSQGAIQNVKNSTARADLYLDAQLDLLESDQYKTLMRNNLAAGSYLQSITNSINTKTLPLINRNLQSSDALISSLNSNTATLNTLIANLDYRVSGDKGLLPTTTAMIDSVRVLTENELRQAVAEFALAGRNVRILTESPELQNLPGEIAKLTESAGRSAGKVEVILDSTQVTSANIASITGNLNSIADDSAKKVHTLLNPPPAPFWKKYILTPLREIGGVTYLLVKIANGL
jgi:hypothetical protein